MRKSKLRIKVELQCIAHGDKFKTLDDARLAALITYNTVYEIQHEYHRGTAKHIGHAGIYSLVATLRRLIQEAAYWEPEDLPMWIHEDHYKKDSACHGQIFHKVYFRHGKYKFFVFDSFHTKPSRYTEKDLIRIGYKQTNLKEVLENWRKFKLYENRHFEALLVYLYCSRHDLEFESPLPLPDKPKDDTFLDKLEY